MKDKQLSLPLWIRQGNKVPYGGSLRSKYHIEKNKYGECWIWSGARSSHDPPYGRVKIHGVQMQAHRAVWEELIGPITLGMDLDHWVCFDSLCVNPAHLREKEPEGHRYRGLKGRR